MFNVNKYIKIFITAFFQVFFVALNTFFIAKEKMELSFIAAIFIAILWTYNVRSIVVGTRMASFVYAIGSGTGSLVAIIFAKKIIQILSI